jgi:hypothetical protein
MSKKRLTTIILIVAAAIAIAITSDALLANHQPVIASLEAEPEGVLPAGSCQIVCTASDPDGNELSYNWSASEGHITGTGPEVTWTAPYFTGSYNVTVTVTDGRGGEDTDQITIAVRANKSPIITSLVADADWITPSGSMQVMCNASDPDGDELNYSWSTDGGDIYGTGVAVNWTAPQEIGAYNITVVVTDAYGGEDVGKLLIYVDLGTPPTVEKLIVTPNEHTFLRKPSLAGCDCDVWKNRDYNVQCIASGTGELVYEWSCDDGDGEISEASEDGSIVTWTAPDKTSTEATVMVIVSDATGNSVGKNIVFHIPSCTCGSWGLKSLEISF